MSEVGNGPVDLARLKRAVVPGGAVDAGIQAFDGEVPEIPELGAQRPALAAPPAPEGSCRTGHESPHSPNSPVSLRRAAPHTGRYRKSTAPVHASGRKRPGAVRSDSCTGPSRMRGEFGMAAGSGRHNPSRTGAFFPVGTSCWALGD
jgi:hypothetical protein